MKLSYLYFVNYAEGEEALCDLEFKTIFGQTHQDKLLETTVDFQVSRSVFVKQRLSILARTKTFAELVEAVKQLQLSFESYKILYLKLPGYTLRYHDRLKALGEIGLHIEGPADMYQPKQLLGVTEVNGEWLFGLLELNDNEWSSHENKPYSYSFSCGVRTARTMANLAVGHNVNQTVIDPCCGVGTVVLELLTIGATTFANELNDKVATQAMFNMKTFGHEIAITIGDIATVQGQYDTVIIDLPYGHFSPIEASIQKMIMHEARRLGRRLIILTQVVMNEWLEEAGFTVLDQCHVRKSHFMRYVTICE